MTPKRKKLSAGVLGILLVIVPASEGLRQYAYRDPVGIPTICFGETRGVKMGQHRSVAECKEMLIPRLEEFHAGVASCVRVPMSDKRTAAMVSFAYNVGVGAFCKSTLVRRLNEGHPRACDELSKWNKAGGITLPGLTRRRQEERALCNS